MGRYIKPEDLYRRYSQTSGTNPAVVDSHYIYYAENYIDELLGPYFTVPFSSDNVTAKDLALEYTYILSADLKFEDREKREAHWLKRIDRLIDGKSGMQVTSATMYAVNGTIYNSTENYHPVFGMGDPEDYFVDSSQVYDEYQDRHI